MSDPPRTGGNPGTAWTPTRPRGGPAPQPVQNPWRAAQPQPLPPLPQAPVQPPVTPIMSVATIPPQVAQWTVEMLRVLGWNSKRAAQGGINTQNGALLQAQAGNASPALAGLAAKHAELDRAYAANGVWSSAQEMAASEIRATLAFEGMPGQKPELKLGSANPTFWLKGAPDPATGEDREFIFKPMSPVSLMGGVPVGGEPIREAMAGRAAEQLTAITGLDFQMPLTNVISVDSARLSDYDPEDETMKLPNTPTQVGSMQQFSRSQGDMRSNFVPNRQNITAQSCQNIAILDTVMLNLDRHDGNLLMDAAGTGVIPIDHGLSFPGRMAVSSGAIGRNIAGDKNVVLRLPGSYEPFSQASLDGLADLDPDLMAAGLAAEAGKMGQAHPALAGTMSTEALTVSKLSMAFLKEAAPHLPPAVLQAALGANAKALLDVTATPQALAQARAQAIAEFRPKVNAIKAFWMMPQDEREALYARLQADGLLASMTEDRERWLYQNIDMVMEYKAGSRSLPAAAPRIGAPDADEARTWFGQNLPNIKLPKQDAELLQAWSRIVGIGLPAELSAGLASGDKQKLKSLGEVEAWFRTYMKTRNDRDKQARIAAIRQAFPTVAEPDESDTVKAWIALGRLGGMSAVRAKVQGPPPVPMPRDPRAALLLLLAQPATTKVQALKGIDYLDELVQLDGRIISDRDQTVITNLRTAVTSDTTRADPLAMVKALTDRVTAAAVPLIVARYKALEFRVSAFDWRNLDNYMMLAYSGQLKDPLQFLLRMERTASPTPIRT